MAVFESTCRPNMDCRAALDLVVQVISASIFNDLGSDSNVDACVITRDHTENLRNYRRPNERAMNTYKFRRGTAWTAATAAE